MLPRNHRLLLDLMFILLAVPFGRPFVALPFLCRVAFLVWIAAYLELRKSRGKRSKKDCDAPKKAEAVLEPEQEFEGIDLTPSQGYRYGNPRPMTDNLSKEPSQIVGELLAKWRAGDQEALQTLIPLVYKDLRAMAHGHLKRERPGHTLQTTALVHEAYLRLVGKRPFEAENRKHFVAVAARLMRQILVDYARSRGAAKRGADRQVELDTAVAMPQLPSTNVLAMDDALNLLAQVDEQQSRIVELRFFGGLTEYEIADLLQVSPITVKRDWRIARAVLHHQLGGGVLG